MKRRVQDFLKNLGSEAREAFVTFPVTMVLVLLWTVAMILEDIRIIGLFDKQLLSYFLGFFMAGSYFVESLTGKNYKRKGVLECIAAIIAGVFVFFLWKEYSFYQMLPVKKGVIYWGGCHRLIAGYCILSILGAVFICYRRSALHIETYCLKVFQQVVRMLAIYIFISLGCAAIMGSFVFLILEGRDYGLVRKLEWAVFGLYLLPSLALSFCDMRDEISRFTERVVKYVLLPLVTGCVFIVYLYFIKMMIPFTIPSNQIFRMLAGLFLFGMIVWTLLGHFHDETLFMRVAEKMPYAFLPLLLLQGYTLGIRLAHYGLTPNRYFGILFMLFEFLYFCVYHLRKEKIAGMALIFGVMVLIATWIPGINMMSISIRSQKYILEQYFMEDIDEAPAQVWQRIYGAYVWLSEQPECQAYLEKNFDQADILVLQEKGNKGTSRDLAAVYADRLISRIPIEEYRYMIPVHAESQTPNHMDTVELLYNESSQNKDSVYDIVDMQNVISQYINQATAVSYDNNPMQAYLKKHNIIQISNTKVLYLDSISFRFYKGTNQISQYKLSGYILEK